MRACVVANSSLNERISLGHVCSNYESGTWSHDSDQAFALQLLAEGRKRLDAFVFERGFEKVLREIAVEHELSLALGWYVGYDRAGCAYWIRLVEPGNAWVRADDDLLGRLTSSAALSRTLVVRAEFDGRSNAFIAQRFTVEGWEPYREARSLFYELTRQWPRPVREMSHPGEADVGPALGYLFHFLPAEERRALSIRRRFVNGLLSPHLGRDPTDLDAVVLSPQGNLTYIEMKRKYPATGRHKYFGIDEWPHLQTMKKLDPLGIRTLHVILVAPEWTDRESPVGWLRDKSRHDKWTWLTSWLREEAFVPGINLATSGNKSGQRSFPRSQRAIDWTGVHVLNQGLRITEKGREDLASLLKWKDPELAGTSYTELQRITIA